MHVNSILFYLKFGGTFALQRTRPIRSSLFCLGGVASRAQRVMPPVILVILQYISANDPQ